MNKHLLHLGIIGGFFFLLQSCTATQAVQTAATVQNSPVVSMVKTPAEKAGISEERLAILDQHIERYIADGSFPGGTFLISRKGETVYHKSFGYQDDAKTATYKNDNIYRLASMTKAVTTVSILQLYEQGKLGLDDPIHYYIPAFNNAVVLGEDYNPADTTYNTVPAAQPITIRHLLTHTSGITYGLFNPGKISAIYEKQGANQFGLSHPEMTTEQMVNTIATVPLIFQPGTKYMYGLNMEVLGRIVEVVSGMPLNQYFRKNIFDPVGMDDTYFYLPKDRHDRLVPFYMYDDKGKSITAKTSIVGFNVDYPTISDNNHYAGGGGLSGTAEDYAKFIQVLCTDGTYKGVRLLSRNTIDVMTSDQLILLNQKGTGFSPLPGITYGLGFALKTEAGSAWSAKSPGTFEWGGAFNTKFFIDPSEELIFVGMGQTFGYRRPDFWERLYTIIYGTIE